jgi:hypothetical protein
MTMERFGRKRQMWSSAWLAGILAVSALLGTSQEITYGAPTPPQSEAGCVASPALENHAHYFAVNPINRATAGSGPRWFVQNKTKHSAVGSLITPDVGARGDRDQGIEREPAKATAVPSGSISSTIVIPGGLVTT